MEIFIAVKVLVVTAITICGPKEVKSSVPGKWGPWSEVSACSTSCGMGVQERKRIWETNPPQKSPFTMTNAITCYEGACTYGAVEVSCSNHEKCRMELFRECRLVNSWYRRNCPLMCNLCSSTAFPTTASSVGAERYLTSTASPTTASSVGAERYLTSTIDIQSFVEGQTGETVTTNNQSSAACADKETCTRHAIEDCNLTGSWSSTNCPALCGLCLRAQASPTLAIQMDSIVPTGFLCTAEELYN